MGKGMDVPALFNIHLDEARIDDIVVRRLQDDAEHHVTELRRLEHIINDDISSPDQVNKAEESAKQHQFYLQSTMGVLMYYMPKEEYVKFSSDNE